MGKPLDLLEKRLEDTRKTLLDCRAQLSNGVKIDPKTKLLLFQVTNAALDMKDYQDEIVNQLVEVEDILEHIADRIVNLEQKTSDLDNIRKLVARFNDRLTTVERRISK